MSEFAARGGPLASASWACMYSLPSLVIYRCEQWKALHAGPCSDSLFKGHSIYHPCSLLLKKDEVTIWGTNGATGVAAIS